MNRNILSISALDPSGCNGITVDMKTLMAWRMYGIAVATAVVSQNTQRLENVYPIPMEVIGNQIEAIANDIEIHAVKVGILPGAMTMELVVELIRAFKLTGIVVDPVLRSHSGFAFADEKEIQIYREKLFPLAECVTPNMEEAGILAKMQVTDIGQMKQAAEVIQRMGAQNVVVTGGHLEGRAMDVLYDGVRHQVYEAPRIASTHTQGLGDTFSTIMALHIAKKVKLQQAIDPAKKYIARAMVHPFKIGGGGNGPLNHNVAI